MFVAELALVAIDRENNVYLEVIPDKDVMNWNVLLKYQNKDYHCKLCVYPNENYITRVQGGDAPVLQSYIIEGLEALGYEPRLCEAYE